MTKLLLARWLGRILSSGTKAARPAARLRVEPLEPRVNPVSVGPGQFSSNITGPVEFDTVGGTYEIVGNLTVTGTGALTVAPGVNFVIYDDVKLTVAGALNVNSPASFVTKEQFSNDGNPQGVIVSGTMSVTNATIGVSGSNGTDVSFVQVLTGGRLTASGATFAGDVVAWDPGSQLASGNVANSAFDVAVHAPVGHVGLLAGNKQFRDVNLNSTTLAGPAVTLAALGTVTTANERYVFSGLDKFGGSAAEFKVGPSATLTFGAGTKVVVRDDVDVSVQSNGTLRLDGTAGSPVTFETEEQFSNDGNPQGVTVAGTMTVTNATVGVAGSNGTDVSLVQVLPNGRLTATAVTFGVDVVAWDTGSLMDPGNVVNSTFDGAAHVPANLAPRLADNKQFRDVHLNSGSPTGAPLVLAPLGTVTTTNMRYVFSGKTGYGGTAAPFAIASGATVKFAAGSAVVLRDDAAVDVQAGGTLVLDGTPASPVAVEAEEQFSNDGNPQGITVAGTMTATSAAFAVAGTNGTDVSLVRVASGGQLSAAGSTFGWDVVAWDNGALVPAAAVVGSVFDAAVHVPADLAPRLADNKQFRDVHLNSATLANTTVSLAPLGTVTTANMRYVFSGTAGYGGAAAQFKVGGGATLNVAAGSAVLFRDDAVLNVQTGGAVNLTGTVAAPVTVETEEQFSNDGSAQGVVVSGAFSATSTAFATSATGTDVSLIQAASGGTVNLFGGSFALDALLLDSGSAGTINYVLVNGKVQFHSGSAVTVAFNDFSGGNANVTTTGPTTPAVRAENNYWGTVVPGEIETLKLTDDSDAPTNTRPPVDFDPFLTDRPVQPQGAAVPAVAYNPGGTQNVSLSATFTTTVGVVNSGTATFSIVQGANLFGTAQTVNVANGAAGVVYVLPAGVNAGSYTIKVVYDNGSGSTFTDTSRTLVISQLPQTITFTPPSPLTFGTGSTINLGATSDRGLTIAYTVLSGPGSVSGSTLTINGAGTIVVRARQTGTINYAAAADVVVNVVVNQAPQTITFNPPPPATFTPGLTVGLTATGGASGNTVTYTVISGPGTVNGSVLTVTGAGAIVVRANQNGNANYSAATFVEATVTINQAAQTITFNTPTPVGFAANLTVNLAATTTSGLAIAYTVVSGPATVAGNVLTVTGTGNVVIDATQPGNANYSAAVTVQRTLVVNPGTQTITFNPPPPTPFAANLTINLGATGGGSGNPVTYSVVSGPGTVSGNTLTVTAAGAIVVLANQAASANYNAANPVQVTVTINPAAQTITFPTPPPVTFTVGLTVTLTATGGASGNPVTYTVVSGPGTVSGNTLTVTAAGSIVVRASQTGTANYAAATSVDRTVVVNDPVTFAATPVPEFRPGGATAGTLGVSLSGSYTFALVAGAGDADNAAFAVVGNQLRTARPLDAGRGAYSVRVRATPASGPSYDRVLSVTATNDPALALANRRLTVTGTSGADTFALTAGAAEHLVVRNGVTLAVRTADADEVFFDGQGGDDAAVFTLRGTGNAVSQFPGSAVATGAGYKALATAERVTVYGGPTDAAYLNDSAGDDVFVAAATYAVLQGAGFTQGVVGFGTVTGYGAGGADAAYLSDTAGNDVYSAGPGWAFLVGTGFWNAAVGFDGVTAYASTGSDAAYLNDSAGNDRYSATPTYAFLAGVGFWNTAVGFDGVTGFASAGLDEAFLTGSAGDDVLSGSPGGSFLAGGGFWNTAVGFDRVNATGGGGTDAAYLTDSPGDDVFVGSAGWATLSGPGYFIGIDGFAGLNVYGTSGGRNTRQVGTPNYFLEFHGTWV